MAFQTLDFLRDVVSLAQVGHFFGEPFLGLRALPVQVDQLLPQLSLDQTGLPGHHLLDFLDGPHDLQEMKSDLAGRLRSFIPPGFNDIVECPGENPFQEGQFGGAEVLSLELDDLGNSENIVQGQIDVPFQPRGNPVDSLLSADLVFVAAGSAPDPDRPTLGVPHPGGRGASLQAPVLRFVQ